LFPEFQINKESGAAFLSFGYKKFNDDLNIFKINFCWVLEMFYWEELKINWK
jgi:hypothetical protein